MKLKQNVLKNFARKWKKLSVLLVGMENGIFVLMMMLVKKSVRMNVKMEKSLSKLRVLVLWPKLEKTKVILKNLWIA